MAMLLQDLRYALRTLRKSPLFTMVAVLSLALGIGANTAIFTLIHQLILELLPVKQPEELVLLMTSRGQHYGSNRGSNAISYPMYQDFRDKNQVFSGMFCKFGTNFSLSFEGRTELVSGELVSGNYFPVLGVGAAVGRVFNASDDLTQGGHPLAVLSYGFWKTRFGGNRNAIGARIGRAWSSDWRRRSRQHGRNWRGPLKDQAGSVVGGTAVGLRKFLVVAQVDRPHERASGSQVGRLGGGPDPGRQ